MKFVLASRNEKKRKELEGILGALGIEIVPLPENAPEPYEDGESFEANALIKARSAAQVTGLPAIADDSGLCVDALGGAPGVHSARYGSEEYCAMHGEMDGAPLPQDADDRARTLLLLRQMEAVPGEKRQAAFVCALACVLPDGREFTARGTCAGQITRETQGQGGFGYDPVFFVPAYGCTFGELPQQTKNEISHRARALKAFADIFSENIGE